MLTLNVILIVAYRSIVLFICFLMYIFSSVMFPKAINVLGNGLQFVIIALWGVGSG